MPSRNPIEAGRLRDLLFYDPDTGVFSHRVDYKRRKAGTVAGFTHPLGYRLIFIDGRSYKAAWLAILYVTGKWPVSEVDHRNKNRGDDRFANLREATRSQNCANRGVFKNNKAGIKGVDLTPAGWRARIRKDGQLRHIGYFPTSADASAAYQQEAQKVHGEFASETPYV